MSNPEHDSENPDTESMFDFLAGEDEGKRARQKQNKAAAKRELPIIRKPVPISKSGPLLPPKPGAPVEPPPQLTTGQSDAADDDLSFLADVEHSAAARKSGGSAANAHDNVTPLRQSTESRRNKNDAFEQDFDDLGLELDDGVSFDNDWREGRAFHYQSQEADTKRGGFRWLVSLAAVLVVGAGVASFIFSDQLGLSNPLTSQQGSESALLPKSSPDQITDTSGIPIAPTESQSSPLMTRFRAELTQLEALVSAGSLDDADQLLESMDRTVYGYGAREFGEIELRIAGLRSGDLINDATGSDEARLAAETAKAEAARVEQARLATEAAEAEAARVEQARLATKAAEAEAARVEQARLATEAAEAEAARVEQARLATQAAEIEAARVEQARLATEAVEAEAARVEQARLATQAAEVEAARVEQARLATEAAAAEAARLATLAAQAQTAAADTARQEQARAEQIEASRNEADRRATDKRIAEERAAIQRQEARDSRLQQARERQAALARIESERLTAEQRATEQLAVQNERAIASATAPDTTVATATIPISDDDLQLVYRRFANLQKAVRDRDINAVVSLTQRSGIRVQQIMQMFENSVDIDARIRNVSTSNATGEINGTLQIKKIQRADGSVTEPPASLASIRLSSKREPAGWSAISW